MRYKKYPKYKDSGVEWLGEIPEDWNKTKLKFLGFTYGGLSGKAGKDFNDEDNKLSKPFIPFTNIAKSMYIEDNYFGLIVINEGEEQNRAKKDDLFFLMSSEDYEDLGKSSLLDFEVKELYLNSFCKGFRLLDKDIFPKFLNYLLHGDIYRKLLSMQGNGFTRINLRLEKLNDLNLYLPPLQEQKAIANYLDKATQKIDTLIQKQEKLIELLKEKRQALISHAVTKGLNPDVKMKDSGVEWLGEIPEHWVKVSMKWISNIYAGGTPDKTNLSYWTDGTIPWINSGEVNQFFITKPTTYITKEAYANSSAKWIKADSLVVALAGQGRTKGMVARLGIKTTCNQSMAAIETINEYESRLLLWWMTANYQRIRNMAGGDLRDGLNLDLLGNIPCPFMPLEEQKLIADYLDEKTTKIDTLITKTTKAIELLKERKTALISAVVTGKIDVREFNE